MHSTPGARAAPVFRDLNRPAIDAVLMRNVVGRLAYAYRDRVDIEPLHYVYDDGWIYGRTSAGTKLATLEYNPWVAFEVDEVEGMFEWRSVVVRGSFHLLPEEGSPRERALRAHGIARLRDLVPSAFGDADPTPFRDIVFRIAVGEANGRECLPPHAATAP